MAAYVQDHSFGRPTFGGCSLPGGPLAQPSIDRVARDGFWVTEPPNHILDAATPALRARIAGASPLARLSGLLRLTR